VVRSCVIIIEVILINHAIVGGGIVGLATALRLTQRHPSRRVVVLEKESAVCRHQSGHNSGVIHSGIYYKPGSLKAQTCVAGGRALREFCDAEGIRYDVCGKLIVATEEHELPQLRMLAERGAANGVACRMLRAGEIAEIEPHAAGIAALHVPGAAVVDYREVCERMAAKVEVMTSARVTAIEERSDCVRITTTSGVVEAEQLINCAGLQSDRVASLGGSTPPAKIVPFRGEYFVLRAEAAHLCRALIYPVPDIPYPFLGVHFTRGVDGSVHCGPNAVLAFAREGYRKRDVRLRDLAETLTYRGFVKLAAEHWRTGAFEMWRSLVKPAFARAAQRLVPELCSADLLPGGSGVRAQAVDPSGKLVDDFAIVRGPRSLHVINAPSPAATASLAIGELIAGMV